MKQTHWLLAILLLAMACATTVPPGDDPETAFDEGDAPVSLALPVLLPNTLGPRATNVILLPKLALSSQGSTVNHSAHGTSPLAQQRCRHPLQNLLCTLLI
ncbi:MAG TPA: hypothetical protein VEI52_06685 [Terriglobales bacterium]|nr:hypothetical protein [Terriglobales bacterium]